MATITTTTCDRCGVEEAPTFTITFTDRKFEFCFGCHPTVLESVREAVKKHLNVKEKGKR